MFYKISDIVSGLGYIGIYKIEEAKQSGVTLISFDAPDFQGKNFISNIGMKSLVFMIDCPAKGATYE